MDTNKMREQFIDWLKTQPHVLNVGFNESTGKFVLAEDETAWQAWQASREAVAVEIEQIRSEAKRQEDGLKEMLRRQNKQICAFRGKS